MIAPETTTSVADNKPTVDIPLTIFPAKSPSKVVAVTTPLTSTLVDLIWVIVDIPLLILPATLPVRVPVTSPDRGPLNVPAVTIPVATRLPSDPIPIPPWKFWGLFVPPICKANLGSSVATPTLPAL